jgi:hypothetical protein
VVQFETAGGAEVRVDRGPGAAGTRLHTWGTSLVLRGTRQLRLFLRGRPTAARPARLPGGRPHRQAQDGGGGQAGPLPAA